MEFGKLYTTALIRWAHILLGIMWIGFFFFMHMIVKPYIATLSGDAKVKAYRALITRGLRWCRGTSLATLLLGIGALGHLFMMKVYSNPETGLNGRGKFIMWGMTLAIVMLVNLWVLISPLQKRIAASFESGIGASEGDMAKAGKLAALNAYLAAPMLMIMVFAQNFGTLFHYGHLGLAIVIGLATMHIMVLIARKGD